MMETALTQKGACAPVAMFVYNRLDNTQVTLKHLLANTLAGGTDLYVFSDGGRDAGSWEAVKAVRAYLRQTKKTVEATKALNSMTIIERPVNYYLERNIMEGIRYVLERHDRIIVLEDDIMTSPFYLEYMNEAFRLYQDVKNVMHVSGFTNLDILGDDRFPKPYYFTPHMSGWGWGTWKDRWDEHFRHFDSRAEALAGLAEEDLNAMQYGGVFPCLKSLDKSPIPWDVCWEIAIYKARGLCLTPAHTMVRNVGLNNGTHFSSSKWIQHYEYDRWPLFEKLKLERDEQPEANPLIENLFREAIRDWGIRYTMLGKILRAPLLLWRRMKRS